ncbi:hypothetical protein D3C81_2296170 [compost metagenome]
MSGNIKNPLFFAVFDAVDNDVGEIPGVKGLAHEFTVSGDWVHWRFFHEAGKPA